MKIARWIGIFLQALVLGVLLFFAIGELIAIEGDARVFRYEAY